jgi:hypothetical protein
MGLFSPKYPPGAEPPSKPKRQTSQQRLDARVAAANARDGAIDEAYLRNAAATGAEVFRRADHVAVRTKIPGGYQLATYIPLGNGKYKAPRNHR